MLDDDGEDVGDLFVSMQQEVNLFQHFVFQDQCLMMMMMMKCHHLLGD